MPWFFKLSLVLSFTFASLLGYSQPTDYISFYPFNGNANDETANSRDGTVTPGVTLIPDNEGKLNAAYSFPGVNGEFIYLGDHDLFSQSDEVTIAAWIFPKPGGMGTQAIFYTDQVRLFYRADIGSIQFNVLTLDSGSGMGITVDSWVIPENQWSYIVCTYDGNEGRVYVNCKRLVAFPVQDIDINLPESEVYIGTGGIKNNFELNFKGYIDDVMIFDRGITDDEAKALYPSVINESADILSYSFSEETSSSLIDIDQHKIDVEVNCTSDLTNLIATFTLEEESTAKVNGEVQTSGITPNDFSTTVIYTIGGDAECYQTLWQVNVRRKLLSISSDSITNIITPNNDSRNEFLMVSESYKGSQVRVMNRYGKEVYFNPSYQNDFSGAELSSGVYYYVLINNCFEKPIRGAITIRR